MSFSSIAEVDAAMQAHYRDCGRPERIPEGGFFGFVASAWPDNGNLTDWISAWEETIAERESSLGERDGSA